MKKLVLTLSLTLPALAYSYAQEAAPCGLIQATEALRAQHPGLYEMEMELEALEALNPPVEGGPETRAIKVIPVVVHIIHNYGVENISDAQVHDAIRILNEDFQGLQPDTANIANPFKPIFGYPDFEFRLARKDPDGNCTNGITRTVSTHTFNAGEEAKVIAPIWPRNEYMNVWVVQRLENGAGGYTYRPGTAAFMPQQDGIILVNRQFGGIGTSTGGLLSKRTLSHETGHWFNLKHTWGDSNTPGESCGSDDVNDTPTTMGVATQNCNLNTITCGVLNNVQNIMDYSSCPIMFTEGQADRMVTSSNSGTASRSNLSSPANLFATGVSDGFSDTLCEPIADFNAALRLVCVGGSLTFTDLSYNGVVTTRAWTFTNLSDGVTVLNSSAQNPSMSFPTPGLYSVSLTVTNSEGSDAVTKSEYIRVYPADAQYSSNGYTEDFEGNIDNIGWFIQNDAETSGWQVTSAAAISGTKSMVVRNFFGEGTESYNLISPSYDLSIIPSPKLRFKYAYTDRETGNDDRLRVYASKDCNPTWFQLSPPLSNAALNTASPINGSAFVPNDNQWLEKEFSIPANILGSDNVRFRFEFDADGGNNFYLDDINIPGGSSIDQYVTNGLAWDVYPNPADEYVDIRISGNGGGTLADNLLICDASGRVIQRIPVTGAETVLHTDVSTLATGVYFIRSEKGLFAGTKKVIIR